MTERWRKTNTIRDLNDCYPLYVRPPERDVERLAEEEQRWERVVRAVTWILVAAIGLTLWLTWYSGMVAR